MPRSNVVAQQAFRNPGGIAPSELVQMLAGLAPPGAPGLGAPLPPLGETLARWLHWTDAVALAGALAAPPSPAAAASPAAGDRVAALRARLRRGLAQAMRQAAADPADDPASELPALRRFVRERQRALEAAIAAERRALRETLAGASPDGAALAALDAALEQALAPRERLLLGGWPALLEPRWRGACGGAATPAARAALREELLRLLEAETELRLEPLAGLQAAAPAGPAAADPDTEPMR